MIDEKGIWSEMGVVYVNIFSLLGIENVVERFRK